VNHWTRRVTFGNPELDHGWFSGLTFSALWGLITQMRPPHRFTRIAFTHESIFAINSSAKEDEEAASDEDTHEAEAIFWLTERSFRTPYPLPGKGTSLRFTARRARTLFCPHPPPLSHTVGEGVGGTAVRPAVPPCPQAGEGDTRGEGKYYPLSDALLSP
jgi:hypothetical protein